MGSAVEVTWTRCPDGVELVDLGPPYGNAALALFSELSGHREQFGAIEDGRPRNPKGQPSGYWLKYRSAARETYTRRLDGVGDALAFEFINASRWRGEPTSESFLREIVEFFSRHGLADAKDAARGEGPLESTISYFFYLRTIVEQVQQGRVATSTDLFEHFAEYLVNLKPRLRLLRGASVPTLSIETSNLFGFMSMEVASLLAGGVTLHSCLNCGSIFASGTNTGRRKTAFYCSNRCRVAHQRKTEKSKASSKKL